MLNCPSADILLVEVTAPELTYAHRDTASTAPVQTAHWTKWLSPSLSDLFFLFITAWMFMVNPLGWQMLLRDADTAFHIRIGQYILSSGNIPHQDLFSFSKPAQPWYAFEWLSETLFGFAYNSLGLKGVTLIAGVLIALAFTVVLKQAIWRGANGIVALIVVLLSVTVTTIHFHARPHLFTLLLLANGAWMLEYNRRCGGSRVWLLVPITALWANLHGGFFIFLALLALRAVGCAAEAWFWPELRLARRKEARQLGLLLLACTAATLANPYGIHLHLHILETLKSPWIMTNVSEFSSPVFRGEEMLDFMLLLFFGLACLDSLVRKKNVVEALWVLFLAYCSLISVRHATLYVLITAPILAIELTALWNKFASQRTPNSIAAVIDEIAGKFTARLPGTSLFIPAAILALALLPGLSWPRAFPEGEVPVQLVERNHDALAAARVFTSDQIGDYLIFRNYPRQRVFIDSRHNYYGPKIGDDYLSINDGRANWRSLLDQYGFNLLLIPRDAPLASLVQAGGGWRRKDQTSKYVLFER